MSKKAAAGLGVAVVLLITLSASVYMTNWDGLGYTDEMHNIDYGTHESSTAQSIFDDFEASLNYKIFEEYGPLLLVLAMLMFGAMVGGICVAREEDESVDTD
ncbi:MAG: hypothetical protein J5707_05165 [Candidatus Methanomethylophilus sp.]|nr:hypothetical protein [Methanomethylophilus sp.]